MNNAIGLSTGVIHKWTGSIDDQLDVLRKTGVKNIEINFASPEALDQRISIENILYLRSLGYVSIHAPFYQTSFSKEKMLYKDDAGTRRVLERIKRIYTILDAKAVVFHPEELIAPQVIKEARMNSCVENMERLKGVSLSYLRSLCEKHGFPIILDTGHALTYGEEYLGRMVQGFGDQIQHVHFSDARYYAPKKSVRPHQALRFCQDMSRFDPIKDLRSPIIIEIDVEKTGDIAERKDLQGLVRGLREEENHVKAYFKANSKSKQ